jgi:ribonuclease Z
MTLYTLGTGAAVSDPFRSTTMLAVEASRRVVLIDCGGDVGQRAMAAGIPLDRIEALILTHEHPDHVAGFPLLMEKLWLSGRDRSLPVYGIGAALEQAQRSFAAFDTSGWTGMPEIVYREIHPDDGRVPDAERAEPAAVALAGCEISAAWGRHSVPVSGLRIRDAGGAVLAYSADTEYAPSIVRLAHDADLLVHEATGSASNHSSATDAARVAREAGARALRLVHLPPDSEALRREMSAARTIFEHTEKAVEGGTYPVGPRTE